MQSYHLLHNAFFLSIIFNAKRNNSIVSAREEARHDANDIAKSMRIIGGDEVGFATSRLSVVLSSLMLIW
jgi:hypothetical protein